MILTVFALALASPASQPDLQGTVRAADARLFRAFNACDMRTMEDLLARDLEFYHDIGGVSGYDDTLAVTRENCERNLGLRRTLVDGSDAVFPVPDFGAIHEGEHTFCHEENGAMDCGTFQFVHVWREVNGNWQVWRVMSYGH